MTYLLDIKKLGHEKHDDIAEDQVYVTLGITATEYNNQKFIIMRR